MLRAGIAGFGFMGRMHHRCWQGTAGTEVVAICDANENIDNNNGQDNGYWLLDVRSIDESTETQSNVMDNTSIDINRNNKDQTVNFNPYYLHS